MRKICSSVKGFSAFCCMLPKVAIFSHGGFSRPSHIYLFSLGNSCYDDKIFYFVYIEVLFDDGIALSDR